ncbi:MAG TPA: SIS domain-containing protein [Chthoniobacterales bacterium]|nr:SIS domain-containing protein [Chthoniobacterales bacterium]
MSTRLPSLFERYPTLRACERDLRAAFDLLATAYRSGNKLLVCGNGGSAADSEHIVGELMKGFLKRRPIPAAHAAKLETAGGKDIASRLQGTLAAISLPSQMSLLTATANDGDYDLTFAQQVYGLGRAGDALLAISTSGKSANVCNAVIVAKAFGLKSIALTGRSGGDLAPLADIAIKVPSDDVAEIQELHLPVYHWLSTELEAAFFAE